MKSETITIENLSPELKEMKVAQIQSIELNSLLKLTDAKESIKCRLIEKNGTRAKIYIPGQGVKWVELMKFVIQLLPLIDALWFWIEEKIDRIRSRRKKKN